MAYLIITSSLLIFLTNLFLKTLINNSQESALKLLKEIWTNINYLIKIILNLMKINISYLHLFLSDIL